MNFFCSQINNGYNANLYSLLIPFKKKYIPILLRLYELNLINSFSICKYKINIKLKYYNNKPLIFLEQISSGGNKQYMKFNNLNKNCTRCYLNPSIYTNNLGIINNDEIFILKIGGKFLMKVHLLYKNIIY